MSAAKMVAWNLRAVVQPTGRISILGCKNARVEERKSYNQQPNIPGGWEVWYFV
jgi:hypothetical protein